MRLYLSSYRMGRRFGALVEALGRGAKVAVVSNATDFIPDEARAAYARTVFDPIAHFNDHGLDASPLDLRTFFNDAAGLETALAGVRLVWANGGNAFLLRRAMRQSGLEAILGREVPVGGLVYGGWSAGAVVAGPTLRGLELMDDPAVVAEGYDPEPIWEGLGLVDFSLVPHFGSDHPEAEAAARAAEWLAGRGMPHRTLRDGEVVVV